MAKQKKPQRRRASDKAALQRSRRTKRNRWVIIVATTVGVLMVAWFAWGRLAGPAAREGAPSWSADGSELVFYAEHGASADLYAVAADGTDRRLLVQSPADEGAPAVSPDGQWIAYDSNIDSNFEIYVRSLGGGETRRLTTNASRDLAPAWSPDGRQIAFMSDRAGRRQFDIFLMNADGSRVEALTTSGSNWFPQWSPDGTRIALHIDRDVHILEIATRQLVRLTREPDDGMYPSWSPDGRRLVFMTARNGPTELYTMNADGSDQRRLVSLPSGSAIDPRWSPAGSEVVFVWVPEEVAGQAPDPAAERAIFVVDVATGRLRRISP